MPRFGSPPIVRVAAGTPAHLVDVAVHAVQLINASLPYYWKLRFSPIPRAGGTDRIVEGEVLIEFAPFAEWPAEVKKPCFSGVGCAHYEWAEAEELRIGGGRVWIDPAKLSSIHLQSATVHELLHVLGRRHADPERFTSVMADSQLSGHVLFPLDREALLAAYGWLEDGLTLPGELATSFGRWADTSLHFRIDIDDVPGAAFGVRGSDNGLSQPWAAGPTPRTNLSSNRALRSTAKWSGGLIGYGFESLVAGNAALSIGLSSLRGNLAFTDLWEWTDLEDFSSESAVRWGNGDLHYRVRVRGNTFVQTGGDEGL